MKDKERKKGPLAFSLCSLSFSLPFFILYNTFLYFFLKNNSFKNVVYNNS